MSGVTLPWPLPELPAFVDGALYIGCEDIYTKVIQKVRPDTEMRLHSIMREQAGATNHKIVKLVAGPGIFNVRVDEMDAVAELLGLETYR